MYSAQFCCGWLLITVSKNMCLLSYCCSKTVNVITQSGADYDCDVDVFTRSLGNPEKFHLECPQQVHVHLRGGKQIVCIRFSLLGILL